jgi:hypothetical protein
VFVDFLIRLYRNGQEEHLRGTDRKVNNAKRLLLQQPDYSFTEQFKNVWIGAIFGQHYLFHLCPFFIHGHFSQNDQSLAISNPHVSD